jgi:hypothetical protein
MLKGDDTIWANKKEILKNWNFVEQKPFEMGNEIELNFILVQKY